ncbi:hypothetical protein CEXT_156441 [Caerostris extrusa]|uniref:Uncharacterized protein n=1 Tax=Caerostris extrusa TaxID=172846 RepID=A0AAV4TW18_CAEEX|nr:hypothetical protein CEXT_156441 [Caerostris extrusa]
MSRGVEATCDAPAEASLNAITAKPDKQEGYQMHLPATHCRQISLKWANIATQSSASAFKAERPIFIVFFG